MPEPKPKYWKLHRIDFSQRLYDVWGVITEFSHKLSYDHMGVNQDEFRFKLQMYPEHKPTSITIYADVGSIPTTAFAIGRCARIHRITVAKFRDSGEFYLRGRLMKPVSLLIVDVYGKTYDVIYHSRGNNKIEMSSFDEKLMYEVLPKVLINVRESKSKDDDPLGSSINDNDYFLANGRHADDPTTFDEVNTGEFVSTSGTQAEMENARTVEQPTNSEKDQNTENFDDVIKQLVGEENAKATKKNVDNELPRIVSQTPQRVSSVPRRRYLDCASSSAKKYKKISPEPALTVMPRTLDECDATYSGRKIVRFKNTLIGHYFNFACQVVSFYNGRNFAILRVWDGSRTPFLTKTYSLEELTTQFDFMFGDKKLERRLQAEGLIYDIYCWNEHITTAAQLQKGNFVILLNTHKVIKPLNLPCFTLHENSFPNPRYETRIEKIGQMKKIFAVMENQIFDALKELPEIVDDEQSPKKSPVKDAGVQTNGKIIIGYNQNLRIESSPEKQREEENNELNNSDEGSSNVNEENDKCLSPKRKRFHNVVENGGNESDNNSGRLNFTEMLEVRITASPKKVKLEPESLIL